MLTKRHKIAVEEGFRPKMYKCTEDKNTIGYGFNLDETEMPQEVADLWLSINIGRIEDYFNQYSWYDGLCYERQLILVDMCYQLGIPKFEKFKKMIAALEDGRYTLAAAELLDSLYANQTPERALRNAEIMRSGKT